MQDELSSLLGIQYTPQQSAALSELARRANDRLRVQNPLATDYYVKWDITGSGGNFLVPGKDKDIGYGPGQAVHPRYIAFKFFKEVSQLILSTEMQMRIEAENKQRSERGIKKMDKTLETGEELSFIMANNLLPNNTDKLLELLPKIILGVEEEWGMETLPYQPTEDKVKWDQVMAIVNKPLRNTPRLVTNPVDLGQTASETSETATATQDILKEIENGGN